MDYAAGKYGGYEAFSARVDAAARERADEFSTRLATALEPLLPEDRRLCYGLSPTG